MRKTAVLQSKTAVLIGGLDWTGIEPVTRGFEGVPNFV